MCKQDNFVFQYNKWSNTTTIYLSVFYLLTDLLCKTYLFWNCMALNIWSSFIECFQWDLQQNFVLQNVTFLRDSPVKFIIIDLKPSVVCFTFFSYIPLSKQHLERYHECSLIMTFASILSYLTAFIVTSAALLFITSVHLYLIEK